VIENDKLENLLFDDFFNKAIHKAQPSWRDVVAEGARLGIPTPAFSTALSWFDGYRSERLPAGLLQAQRDYFGAHTFRILPQFATDKMPDGKDIHVNWVPAPNPPEPQLRDYGVVGVVGQWLIGRLGEVEMYLLRRILRKRVVVCGSLFCFLLWL
jgi:hypothetical protein